MGRNHALESDVFKSNTYYRYICREVLSFFHTVSVYTRIIPFPLFFFKNY